MERQLSIVRHGKSSWDDEALADLDRPLAKRGIRNAGEMALRMKERAMVPDLILSSPANRALSTARLMMLEWELDSVHLQVHEALYMARIPDIEKVIASVSSEIRHLAIFGHNPSFTLFANCFLPTPLDNLPTAGVVSLKLGAESWAEVRSAPVLESLVDYPKKKYY